MDLKDMIHAGIHNLKVKHMLYVLLDTSSSLFCQNERRNRYRLHKTCSR